MNPPPGILRWAVKTSFVRYVRVIAAGTVEVTGGAVLGADDVIEFPLVAAVRVPEGRELSFGGGVRFRAHHGALDVNLTGLRLVLRPDGGHLGIDGLVLATLPPGRELLPTLTEAGVAVFGNVYPAGTGLAPLDTAVPIDF
ncbi:HtaA domain-containing protein [Actinoplanes sp. L3-i22]|uniref:HtaA domain-containing protein n=1 Tax=Actinoplanes sp. L3-i22 TaxID=2836373 RepID=UPI001C7402A1|nr:HtaA domain-containing protein [Actinoplanes sp. L3-i22]BCY09713.1 hypothetical protein L3i22_048010 [Actinoplanes sp. L3-i22]